MMRNNALADSIQIEYLLLLWRSKGRGCEKRSVIDFSLAFYLIFPEKNGELVIIEGGKGKKLSYKQVIWFLFIEIFYSVNIILMIIFVINVEEIYMKNMKN